MEIKRLSKKSSETRLASEIMLLICSRFPAVGPVDKTGLKLADDIVLDLQEQGTEISSDHLCCLIQAALRAKDVNRAIILYEQIPDSSESSSAMIKSTKKLLEACLQSDRNQQQGPKNNH
mmetsp:Transcript_15010/g.23357  ORF Transcript_15010/g.23357 Transcript_15010/m.23357 type:complete len:120 (+) Transcript_15010:1205-1564(+)